MMLKIRCYQKFEYVHKSSGFGASHVKYKNQQSIKDTMHKHFGETLFASSHFYL